MNLYHFIILLLLQYSLTEEKTESEEDVEKTGGIERIDADYEEIKISSTEEQAGGRSTFSSYRDAESFGLKGLDRLTVMDLGGFRPSQPDIFIGDSNIQDERVVDNLEFRDTEDGQPSEFFQESNHFQFITESPPIPHQASSYLPEPQSWRKQSPGWPPSDSQYFQSINFSQDSFNQILSLPTKAWTLTEATATPTPWGPVLRGTARSTGTRRPGRGPSPGDPTSWCCRTVVSRPSTTPSLGRQALWPVSTMRIILLSNQVL